MVADAFAGFSFSACLVRATARRPVAPARVSLTPSFGTSFVSRSLSNGGGGGRYPLGMTTREQAEQVLKKLPEEQLPDALEALMAVERDAHVLRVLRERHPGKSEQELMESLAAIKRGREARERIGQAFEGVDPEEIEREAVKAVREVRQEAAASRRAAG